MRIRAYTIHWRRLLAMWLPAAAVFLYRARSDIHRGIPIWLVVNLFMVLVLLLSIRREHIGLEDDWIDPDERPASPPPQPAAPEPTPLPMSFKLPLAVAKFLSIESLPPYRVRIDRSRTDGWLIYCDDGSARDVMGQIEEIRAQVKDHKIKRACDQALVDVGRTIDAFNVQEFTKHEALSRGNESGDRHRR